MRYAKIRKSMAGWVVEWRTETMPAPSFWYYDTRPEAKRAAAGVFS